MSQGRKGLEWDSHLSPVKRVRKNVMRKFRYGRHIEFYVRLAVKKCKKADFARFEMILVSEVCQ